MLTVTDQIFEVRYYCKVPEIAIMSIEQIEEYGTHLSGQPAVDQMSLEQDRCVALTINELVEMHAKQFNITFINVSDVNTIHGHLQNYLQAIREKKHSSEIEHFHRRAFPKEDVRKMDELAKHLASVSPGWDRLPRPTGNLNADVLSNVFNSIYGGTEAESPEFDNSDLLETK